MDSPLLRADVPNIDGSDNEFLKRIKSGMFYGVQPIIELVTDCKGKE